MVKFKKEIKWRVEDGEKILICHSASTDHFELPFEYLEYIEKLSTGTERQHVDSLLLDELKYTGLVEEIYTAC